MTQHGVFPLSEAAASDYQRAIESMLNRPSAAFARLIPDTTCRAGHACAECAAAQQTRHTQAAILKVQAEERAAAYRQRCVEYMIRFRAGSRAPACA